MLRIRLPLPRFVSAGEVFVGKGSLAALRALDAAKALVLVSRSILKNPELAARVPAAINAHAIRLIEAPAGEPDLEKLAPALAEVHAFQPDWIIAIGGGSVLDAGKLLWVFYEHPDAEIAQIARPFSLPPLRGKCRFVAVPTTAGTGSEVSSSAVLSDEAGAKIPIVSHDLLPDVVVLDPALTIGVPPAAIAAAGLDALAHAIEGYVSRFSNPLADVFAETAARTLFRVLPGTWADPANHDLRLEAMQAAMLAGWVQNLKVPGIGHAIAHQMGRFGIAHGAACGALLASSIEMNARDGPTAARYQRLAEAIGLGGVHELREKIAVLRGALQAGAGLGRLAQGGAEAIAAARDVVTEVALRDVCARANPRTPDAAMVAEVLEAAL